MQRLKYHHVIWAAKTTTTTATKKAKTSKQKNNNFKTKRYLNLPFRITCALITRA